jgi:hypothetical protein
VCSRLVMVDDRVRGHRGPELQTRVRHRADGAGLGRHRDELGHVRLGGDRRDALRRRGISRRLLSARPFSTYTDAAPSRVGGG